MGGDAGRAKPVEIIALCYNALCLLSGWLREEGDPMAPQVDDAAERARESFNKRFWYAQGGHLYDVIDGEHGDDPSCRPNQIFSISLDHPVLDNRWWLPVFDVVRERLLTPVGLRSIAPRPSRLQGELRHLRRATRIPPGHVWRGSRDRGHAG